MKTWKKILPNAFKIIFANAEQTFRKLGNGKACKSNIWAEGACVLEEYSTESRGSANLFEVSTKSLASFSKEVPKNNNSNSTGGH